MNIQPLINAIRYKLRYGITVEWYNFWYMALRCHQKITPQVASIDETIRIIVEDQCSVSRFGDGEMLLTNPDKEIGFQKGNVLLAQRLKEVLTSHEEGHLVCISDTFENIYRYNRKARRFWRTHFFLYGSWWDRLLLPDRLYYNTFITRPYMDFASKEDCPRWFHQMKAIWKDRDVVFMDPPRAGSDEAFLSSVVKLAPKKVVYVSCNPETLARDLKYLTRHGYQAVECQPCDMFPFTKHVEAICLLSKKF